MQKQSVELVWNGEYYMKIAYRQQILFPGLNPGFPLCILAFGTMPVTAAVVTDAHMPASVTGIDMSTQG
jgi:hypothetical protein